MASLIDTNVLVYRVDPRFPLKQRIASELLGERLGGNDELALPHQAIVEFVSAVTRPRQDLDGEPLLTAAEALVEAEELMRQFPVLYPDEMVVSAAFRGAAIYRLSWFDAHLWAYAEVNGLRKYCRPRAYHQSLPGGRGSRTRAATDVRIRIGPIGEGSPSI